jgi:hypothetical protein
MTKTAAAGKTAPGMAHAPLRIAAKPARPVSRRC